MYNPFLKEVYLVEWFSGKESENNGRKISQTLPSTRHYQHVVAQPAQVELVRVGGLG